MSEPDKTDKDEIIETEFDEIGSLARFSCGKKSFARIRQAIANELQNVGRDCDNLTSIEVVDASDYVGKPPRPADLSDRAITAVVIALGLFLFLSMAVGAVVIVVWLARLISN